MLKLQNTFVSYGLIRINLCQDIHCKTLLSAINLLQNKAAYFKNIIMIKLITNKCSFFLTQSFKTLANFT